MNRPEKKAINTSIIGTPIGYNDEDIGYNQACKDWENFLPNKKEIEEIMDKASGYSISNHEGVSEAILKRLEN